MPMEDIWVSVVLGFPSAGKEGVMLAQASTFSGSYFHRGAIGNLAGDFHRDYIDTC